MALNLFQWLEEITYKKTPWSKFTDDDKEAFNSFMINKYISMNENYCDIANVVQKIPHKDKEKIYKVYCAMLPKQKVWLKYIGKSKKKDTLSEDLVKYVSQFYNCSLGEAEDYIWLLKEMGCSSILSKMGVEEKQIKKLIKTIK